jgi:hypothetical protein
MTNSDLWVGAVWRKEREEKSSRGRRSKKEQRVDSRALEKDSPKNKWKNARAMHKCVKAS